MPSESTAGQPADRRGEVGLRKLLESNRTFDPDTTALTQPLNTVTRDRWSPTPGPAGNQPPTPPGNQQLVKRIGIAVGAVLAVGTAAYLADLALSTGEVARGVVVAGIDIGGMDQAEADALLHTELGPKAERPLPVRIGDVQASMVPAAAGLSVDYDRTWDAVGGQPLNPVSRLISLFGTREVPVSSTVDTAALDAQLADFRVHDNPTVEGTVRFENGRPVAVAPVPGRVLDTEAARTTITDRWAASSQLDLPVVAAPVAVRTDAVQAALREIATPAVASPITLSGKDMQA
ncbi:vancomycin resistance protein, partial [Nocardia salmonicida]